MLQAGTAAPAFELKDHLGRTVKLADFKGKRVVLFFYPKADTPGCTKQACGFRDVTAEYRKKGVPTLGISLDGIAENKAFADKFKLDYPLLCDVEHSVALAYMAIENVKDRYAKRYTYVIGADGRIEQAIDTKDPARQAADLIQSL